MRSAFGFGVEVLSVTSRVYVERPVVGEFIDGITAKAEKLAVGDPLDRSVYLGPLIDQHAVERFQGGHRGSVVRLDPRRWGSAQRWRSRRELRPADRGHRPRVVVDLEEGASSPW